MADVEFPLPVVFYFQVKMGGCSIPFREVKGLEYQIETQEVVGGGDNSTVYHLPKKKKYSDLVLNRAITKSDNQFYTWCKKHLETPDGFLNVELKDLQIVLLSTEENEKDNKVKNPKVVKTRVSPLAVWDVKGAYPYKWSMSNLDAMKNEIAIESVFLKFHSISRTK